MSATLGGIRWLYAFTDEQAYARFTSARGDAPGAEPEYREILGARLLDVVVPALEVPAGVALNVADEHGSMLFPPVHGTVPDAAAVDLTEAAAADRPGGGPAAAGPSGGTSWDDASGAAR
ncbi:SseB family protein [Streptomyces sparsus]